VTSRYWSGLCFALVAVYAIVLPYLAGVGIIPEKPLPLREGRASYVSEKLAGRLTASGEPFNPYALTAASYRWYKRTVVVTNLLTKKSVTVYVNDRGPAPRLRRIIDLSPAAFQAIADKADTAHGTMFVSVSPL
jgi:rare lipoprotein A (peptidoglycan hydrolase)